MTKKEMIAKMQLQEAAAWLAFRQAHSEWGSADSITNRRRAEWCAISGMLEVVGIEADQKLPDNQAALELLIAKARARHDAA